MTDELDVPRYRRWSLPEIADRALSLAVTEDDDHERRRTKRLLAGAMWAALLTPWPSFYQLIVADAPLAALSILASFVTAAGVLMVMWLRPSTFPAVFHVVVGVNLAVSFTVTLLFGGFLESGANLVWVVILVLGALAIFEDMRATAWLAVSMVAVAGSLVISEMITPIYELPNPEIPALFNFLIVLVFAYFVVWYYVRQRADLLRLTDGLLKNTLPDTIAERLKTSEEMIADEYESASILFADVSGFTPMSAEMSPTELVALLNGIFTDFDEMVERRDLEKIKTIGDAYMVAAGVPVPRADHAQAICDLALEMQRHVREKSFSGRNVMFRIGINSGPLVAGIIGTRKFSYDLWGDSVNTASRMESSGQPGLIQITRTTRDLVDDDFVCRPGGLIDVKGKGPMPVWFLEGRRGEDGVKPS